MFFRLQKTLHFESAQSSIQHPVFNIVQICKRWTLILRVLFLGLLHALRIEDVQMFKRILVPTDGSRFSDTAFDYAIYFAKSMGSALVSGLSVLDIKMLAGPFLHDLGVSIGLGPFDTYQPKVRQMLQEKAELALKVGGDRCEAAEV